MPAWPAFLYTNPALGKALLQPLFEYQVRFLFLLPHSLYSPVAASLRPELFRRWWWNFVAEWSDLDFGCTQATGQYPNKYSVHDLGAAYPKATGHNDGALLSYLPSLRSLISVRLMLGR